MRMKLVAVVAGVVLVLGASAFADTWNFASPTGTLSTSQAYSSSPGGVSITAYGFYCDGDPNAGQCAAGSIGTATALYGKSEGATEEGLGIAGDPSGQHEINTMEYIALDLTNLFAEFGPSLTVSIGSNQTTEQALFWQGSSSGTVGSFLAALNGNGSSTGTINFTLNENDGAFLQIGASGDGGHNILLSTITTPEPASMVLLGSGLIGLAGLFRRKVRR